MSFGGGFFGSGEKDIKNTNRTENTSINANFQGDNNLLTSFNANNAKNSTFTMLDGGVIDRAFDFAQASSAGNTRAIGEIASLASSALSDASDVAQPVNVNKIIMFSAIAASVIFVAKFWFK